MRSKHDARPRRRTIDRDVTGSRTDEGAPESAVLLDGKRLPVWPADQRIAFEENRTIGITTFDDAPSYHEALRRKVIEIAGSPDASRPIGSAGGTKIYHL